jgi:protein phosphatase
LRKGEWTQPSGGQTRHAQMIRDGLMTPEEAKLAPFGNLLLQALGTREGVVPTIWERGRPLVQGDGLIFCTDGLCDMVDDAVIAQLRHPLQLIL